MSSSHRKLYLEKDVNMEYANRQNKDTIYVLVNKPKATVSCRKNFAVSTYQIYNYLHSIGAIIRSLNEFSMHVCFWLDSTATHLQEPAMVTL
ncbi:hypothetical protein MGYG_04904 [Nannizzia gypsea CBS 118893]|uniref:Uncharacterized protein n=1 Tax=Arthroderma gypseum (strain ATCC MYA-4604 / CBS 118893) TaxID=535722 RepID=E4UXF6_ARTGP|nr:hypothetical protein MGYG_04904 [Nannizzia gypsea CBS 118893]EFR01904.1 hypothetical protein MGYG_04904 [Nannizzia gypsea CBS 118893]